jgi:hypothetical protein
VDVTKSAAEHRSRVESTHPCTPHNRSINQSRQQGPTRSLVGSRSVGRKQTKSGSKLKTNTAGGKGGPKRPKKSLIRTTQTKLLFKSYLPLCSAALPLLSPRSRSSGVNGRMFSRVPCTLGGVHTAACAPLPISLLLPSPCGFAVED